MVGEDTDPYAIRKEDLPVIFEEYDKLAKIMVEREREGRGFTFFHFMIDLEGGAVRVEATIRMRIRHRVSGCDAVGRPVSRAISLSDRKSSLWEM